MPSSLEMSKFMREVLHVTVDSVKGVQRDKSNCCFYLKFVLERRFDSILEKFQQPTTFQYEDGESVKVEISDAGAEFKRVSVSRLPFEVPDKVLSDALAKYGKVTAIEHDVWNDPFFGNLPNGDRTVTMELKLPIPSRIMVERNSVLVSYRDQERTCLYCNDVGHLVANCPNRKKPKPVEQQSVEGKKTYSQSVSHKPITQDFSVPEETYTPLNSIVRVAVEQHQPPQSQPEPAMEITQENNDPGKISDDEELDAESNPTIPQKELSKRPLSPSTSPDNDKKITRKNRKGSPSHK